MTGSLIQRISEYGELVKFEHTIFALPFALSAMLLATTPGQWPGLATVLWILLAMIGGRTYAMGLNRLIDAAIDGRNPRTQNRAIPAGRVSQREAWALVLVSAALLIFATLQLPLICRLLLPAAFVILTAYSYMKRFTLLAHLVLGLALGSSAVGGWLAVTGELTWLPVIFGWAVVFWVSGFDIIYACQDVTFDREEGLHSIPAALGIGQALWISRVFHGLCVALLLLFAGIYPYEDWGLWLAIILTGGMLVYEHLLIRGKDGQPIQLAKINEAFFTINGRISLGVFVLVLLDKFLH